MDVIKLLQNLIPGIALTTVGVGMASYLPGKMKIAGALPIGVGAYLMIAPLLEVPKEITITNVEYPEYLAQGQEGTIVIYMVSQYEGVARVGVAIAPDTPSEVEAWFPDKSVKPLETLIYDLKVIADWQPPFEESIPIKISAGVVENGQYRETDSKTIIIKNAGVASAEVIFIEATS